MQLQKVERIENITKEEFLENYFKPQKPVVIERFIDGWPAFSKWNLDYMAKVVGEKIVSLYDDRPVSHENKFNQPHAEMKMREYVELLKSEPTKYRIFLWNILKEVPELQKDYDIDLANIFHFHFHGKKEVILFDQDQNDYLYKVPHSLITHEDIDFSNPDYERWPALKKAKGFITNLEHGNVLYMPEGYWHYMRYLTPGFSMSLRSIPKKPKNFAKALYNIIVMRHYDNFMRNLKGEKWIDWKNEQAIVRTNKLL